MKWPWISRSRYDDALKRLEELERAVFSQPGAPISVTAENPPAAAPVKDRPLATTATFEHIEAVANRAAADGGVKEWMANRRKVSA